MFDAMLVHRPELRPACRSSGIGFRSIFGFDDEPESPSAPPPRVLVDTEGMLLSVRAALETADRLRVAAQPPLPQIVARPWAEDAGLVTLLQDLLAGARRQSPEYLTARLEQLADDLAFEHGLAFEHDIAFEHGIKEFTKTLVKQVTRDIGRQLDAVADEAELLIR